MPKRPCTLKEEDHPVRRYWRIMLLTSAVSCYYHFILWLSLITVIQRQSLRGRSTACERWGLVKAKKSGGGGGSVHHQTQYTNTANKILKYSLFIILFYFIWCSYSELSVIYVLAYVVLDTCDTIDKVLINTSLMQYIIPFFLLQLLFYATHFNLLLLL